MADRSAIRAGIVQVFAEALHIDAPPPGTDLIGDGVLDSLTFVDLIVQLERRFGITIPLEDIAIDSFRTIDQMAAFIERRQASPAAGGGWLETAGFWAIMHAVGGAL